MHESRVKELIMEALTAAKARGQLNPDDKHGGKYLHDLESNLWAALDSYYREYYTSLLPEKKTMKAAYKTGSDAGWGCTYGFNEAVDDIRQRFEGEN